MPNPQLLYQKSDLILKIQVVDSSRRKLYKIEVNMLNKEKVAEVFETLKLKFNIDIPKGLKAEVDNQTAWDQLGLG